jgi:aspartyl-tRNA(Asn)/glutamyl-tRNA(Gln) amidotransferase subunit B
MTTLEPVIGLEIHAQLLTASKLFCGCPTRFGDPPNTNVCPVCLGLPGALPVLNVKAVDLAVRAALALECTVQSVSVFARKNYLYPDLPKGYQISQYARPLAAGGRLDVEHGGMRRRVGVKRLHLEEDAGRSLHHGFEDSAARTYVDFNRSGVPLVEIVTEPDLGSPSEAAEFFSRLRALLVEIGVNDGNMEEGSLRCDANVSVRRAGDGGLGTRTEIKNLNSFRHLRRALEFETARQMARLAAGDTVAADTRLWDPATGKTVVMRAKAGEEDYRYFPEPDLPPLEVPRAWQARARTTLPELPDTRRRRLERDYGLTAYDADLLVRTSGGSRYFEETVGAGAAPKAVANWMLGEIRRVLKERHAEHLDVIRETVSPAGLAELLGFVHEGRISGSTAKAVFARMLASGRSPAEIVEAERLESRADEHEINALARATIAAHPGAVADYRAGKRKALGYLVGQAMKIGGGVVDPAALTRALEEALERAEE